MNERTQGPLLLGLGAVALRLGLTDAALAYVKPGMRPLLVVTGLALMLLAAGTIARVLRAERAGEPVPVPDADPHGHGHGHGGPVVAWFLVLPLFALLLVAPPPLGAFAASRQAETTLVDTRSDYGPLPPEVEGAVPLTLTEFVLRGNYDTGGSLRGARVRLSGFVSDLDTGEGYQLSRFLVGCCAADARPVDVVLVDAGPPPALDEWLEVEGTWRERAPLTPGEAPSGPPVLEVTVRRPLEPPAQPYEY